ncbi:MAG: hypothetical protein HFI26_04690 [Lachnospiraceae bacterium]|jgi:hypothetical protein|nr:hypothetical protein [Lachnospiraceae bacterium]
MEKVIVYFFRKIRYNNKERGGMNMQAAVKANENISEKTAIEALFSYLDKGIDDVEAGRLHTVDEAFQIIRDRMENEL